MIDFLKLQFVFFLGDGSFCVEPQIKYLHVEKPGCFHNKSLDRKKGCSRKQKRNKYVFLFSVISYIIPRFTTFNMLINQRVFVPINSFRHIHKMVYFLPIWTLFQMKLRKKRLRKKFLTNKTLTFISSSGILWLALNIHLIIFELGKFRLHLTRCVWIRHLLILCESS